MILRMVGDHVLVAVDRDTPCGLDPPDGRSPSPIALPVAHQRWSYRGIVRAVGPGRWLRAGGRAPPTVQQGDRVALSPTTGQLIWIGDQELRILPEAEILAVLS